MMHVEAFETLSLKSTFLKHALFFHVCDRSLFFILTQRGGLLERKKIEYFAATLALRAHSRAFRFLPDYSTSLDPHTQSPWKVIAK